MPRTRIPAARGCAAGDPGEGPWRTRMLRVRGLDLRVLDTGRPDGSQNRPLLLLNGSAAPLEVFTALVGLLAPHRRVIAFDQPGMGASPPVLPTLSIPQLAELSVAVLDGVGADTVDVLGYSFGGGIAQHLSLRVGRRVARLILVASIVGAGGWSTDPVTLGAVIAHHRGGAVAESTREVARRGYGGTVGVDDAALRAVERTFAASPPDPASFVGQAVAAASWSSLAWLWSLRQPTLVLAGDEDLIVPAYNAMVLTTCLPRAELQIVRGGGHLMVFDRFVDVAAAVQAFLDRSDPDGPRRVRA